MALNKWDERFINLAYHYASWSKDPSTKVGAVIVNNLHIPLGMGYNGFPRGVEDRQEYLDNRDIKYKITVHAELNAILNSTQSLHDTTCYCTHFPCAACAACLIQVGVSRVVTPTPSPDFLVRWKDQMELSMEMFAQTGVRCERYV